MQKLIIKQMKAVTKQNLRVGDEVWIKTKVVSIEEYEFYPIETEFDVFDEQGKYHRGDIQQALFINEPAEPFVERVMLVWNSDERFKLERWVIGIFNGKYLVKDGTGCFFPYKYGQEI